MRFAYAVCSMSVLLAAMTVGAQQPRPVAAPPAPPPGDPQFDKAAVERGHELLIAQCGFCHGSNARGGSSGPDLTRSALVQEDEGGKQLGAFLKVGVPDRNMPPFDLSDREVSDLAEYLHSEIAAAINRRDYKILDILTGDPKAGEAFFNGAGKCSSCHSPTGDLKGLGAKYDPAALQGRIVMPRGRGPRPGQSGPSPPPYLDPTAIKVTVTTSSGQAFTGALVRLTDFDVTLYDPVTRQNRSWLRAGDVPRVALTDPLQAHLDMLTKWTDDDMHNMTAYLASLK